MPDNCQACFLEYFLRSQKTYLTISLQKSIDQLDDCQAAFRGRQAFFFGKFLKGFHALFRVQKEVKKRLNGNIFMYSNGFFVFSNVNVCYISQHSDHVIKSAKKTTIKKHMKSDHKVIGL